MTMKFCFPLLLLVTIISAQNVTLRRFPGKFIFGVATASYQVEGGWNAGGKGENIWDYLTHTRPNEIVDRSTGDIACDSYHLYKRDVEMLKELGVDFYRFSLSWSRILPSGFSNKINEDGIRYYNDLINELLNNGITPFVTLYHWDLPQRLQELGGWTNDLMIDYFVNYAKVAFDHFGDRVKNWLTFNEIKEICQRGYDSDYAPVLRFSGIADYLCSHNTLKAHARVYHLYNDTYRPKQEGRISMTLSSMWTQPASNRSEDIAAAQRTQLFETALFADPVFSTKGDYPAEIRKWIDDRSKEQGYSFSRLPSFTPQEVDYIRGTFDFFGLNHYSSMLARKAADNIKFPQPSFNDDIHVDLFYHPDWAKSEILPQRVVPWGFRSLLNWIKNRYENPEVMVFENGFSDRGNLNDTGRVSYYRLYLEALLDAILVDGCNISAYTAWSLMDNFEWLFGYTQHFGLYQVDFKSPNRTRTPKASAMVYKEIIRSREVNWEYDPKVKDGSSTFTVSIVFIFLSFLCSIYV